MVTVRCLNWGLSSEATSILYKTAIEPILTYCSEAFVHRLEVKSFKKILRSIQRRCCLVVCRAPRTARTETVIYASGHMPIDKTILIRHDIINAKWSGLYEGMEFEQEKHWLSKTPIWSFYPIRLAEEQSVAEYEVFTDGSKMEEGVGSGFAVYRSGEIQHERSAGLPPYCTVYQAELTAIRLSLEHFISNSISNTAIIVHTDSTSSIYSLMNRSRQYEISSQIRDLVQLLETDHDTTVSFRWVKAHSGVPGNELSDKLAKEGSASEAVDVDLRMPLSAVKSSIATQHYCDWYEEMVSRTSQWSRKFVGVLSSGTLFELNSRATVQFITGHGLFGEYRAWLGISDDPSCCLCGHELDSPSHALFECRALSAKRGQTLHRVGIRRDTDLAKLNKRNTHCEFIDFCETHHRMKKRRLFAD